MKQENKLLKLTKEEAIEYVKHYFDLGCTINKKGIDAEIETIMIHRIRNLIPHLIIEKLFKIYLTEYKDEILEHLKPTQKELDVLREKVIESLEKQIMRTSVSVTIPRK